ncbi:MAG: VWA domain-containing protein [Deltaproteobacteria bacterium]|nr:VWA domain-containing protein [Deltaproteobacteria bacterium]
MRTRIEALVAALRRDGVAVSIAEAMDAARAAAVVGVDRTALREALAAALVKDERDRATYVAAFEAVFPARGAAAEAARRRRARGAGEGGGTGGGAPTSAGGGRRDERRPAAEREPRSGPARGARGTEGREEDARSVHAEPRERDAEPRREGDDRTAAASAAPAAARRASADDASTAPGGGATLARLDRERRLLRLPFRAMSAADVEACAELARTIAARITARLRRRLRARPRGRLDFRRTIRAAVPRGGVPFDRRWRGRRPGAPDLVALCDLSASAATATDFFLALLAPAAPCFRRVRFFGFVDRLVEIEFVEGQVRPAAHIDLMARSDFGRVLRDLAEREADALGADTVLLILGDARNNRRPPRADLLAAARARVRRALWLNPEPRERWNTGDSVVAAYARHVDAVVACGTLAELERALAVV